MPIAATATYAGGAIALLDEGDTDGWTEGHDTIDVGIRFEGLRFA